MGIFGFITQDIFERLAKNYVLYFYVPAHLALLGCVGYTVFRRWTRLVSFLLCSRINVSLCSCICVSLEYWSSVTPVSIVCFILTTLLLTTSFIHFWKMFTFPLQSFDCVCFFFQTVQSRGVQLQQTQGSQLLIQFKWQAACKSISLY